MNKNVAFGMELLGLLHADGIGNFRQHEFQQPRFAEEHKRLVGTRPGQDFVKLLENAFGGNARDADRLFPEGGPGIGLNGEPEPRGEPDAADKPQIIFFKTEARVADRTDQLVIKVFPAVDIVKELSAEGVEKHPVDGEIAAKSVVLRVNIGDLARVPPVGNADVAAKRRDFEGDAVFNDDHHPEMFADADDLGKEAGNDFGRCVRRDIDVAFFVKMQKHVPHIAAGIQRLVAVIGKVFDDLKSALFFFRGHAFKIIILVDNDL
jgi:hypothetical protein